MNKICPICGKQFKTYPSKIKLGRGKYCSRACSMPITNAKFAKNGNKTRWKKGQMPHNFKGYRFTVSRKDGNKYKLIYIPSHPFSTKAGYVREHRLVVEENIGRYLTKTEIVHHKDGNTINNNYKNLELMDKKEHDKMNVHLNIHKRWTERGCACAI